MADSAAFDFSCEALERSTSLNRLEARGTVRLALKEAGLEAGNVTPDQMIVVVERALAGELKTRGVDDAAKICERISEGLRTVVVDVDTETPETIFEQLGA